MIQVEDIKNKRNLAMARCWSAFPPIIPDLPPGIIEHASEIPKLTS
jgi:hypothetical protein